MSNPKKVLVLLFVWCWWGERVGAQEEVAAPARLDVQHYDVSVEIVPENSFVRGEVQVRLKVLQDTLGLPFELSSRVSLIEVTDEQGVPYSSKFDAFDSDRLRILGSESFKKDTEMTLRFRWEGTLEREEYAFLDTPQTERAVIHPGGAMLLSEGKWFPVRGLSLDAATAVVRVTVPLGFTAVAPGKLLGVETAGVTEIFTWQSERLLTQLPVLVGRYLRQEFQDWALPLTFYVTAEFDRDLRPWAEEISKMLDFYASEFGNYPISHLALVQLDKVELPSTGCAGLILLEWQLLEGKMLPVMEVAKRVARQWWGYSLRVKEAHDAWLQDGFATHAALRYMEKVHPESFDAEFAREGIEALKYEKKAPIIQGFDLKPGSAEYNSIVGSKGALVLYMLGQLVGKERFNQMLTDWYRQNVDRSATTSEFVRFVQEKMGDDYRWFFVQWVESVGIPEFRVDYTVYKLQEAGYKIRGQIVQNLDLFRMPVDVLIETKGGTEEKKLVISGKTTSFNFQSEGMPVRLQLDPHGKILMDSEARQVAVHIALGDELRRKAEFGEAIRFYEKAKGLNPRSSLAHYRLGELFFEQHNYSSAANSFRDALNGDLKPDWVETWTHIYLGKIFDVLGERQRAMAEYQKAINTKIDYNGAQEEAAKYLKEPYSKPRSVIG